MSAKPGILFVNSKIISDTLSPELFRKWYEDIHIPDIFVTSGIKSAFRYYSTTPDKVEWPFLALYPVKDVQWLFSDEFKSIPVHSDVLPNESKAIFELAHFDFRYYETITTKVKDGRQGPAETVVLVAFDSTTDDTTELSEVSTPEGTEPVRSRVFKLAFSRAIRTSEHDRQLAKPAGYLGVYEYEALPEKLQPAANGADVRSFNLLNASGDVNMAF